MTDSPTDIRIGALERDDVRQACRSAARAIVHGEPFRWLRLDADDMEQEAALKVLAMSAAYVRKCVEELDGHNLGSLRHAIHCDLYDDCRTRSTRANRNRAESLESRYDVHHEQPDHVPPLAGPSMTEPAAQYGAPLVAALLPGVFDPLHAWGLRTETAPDRDMPRHRRNPTTFGLLWAMVADCQRAWERAELSDDERRAVFLTSGAGWTQQEAATHQGVDQATISRRCNAGVAKLVTFLETGNVHIASGADRSNRSTRTATPPVVLRGHSSNVRLGNPILTSGRIPSVRCVERVA